MKEIVFFVLMTLFISCGKENKVATKQEVVKEVKSIELTSKVLDNIETYNGEIEPNNQIKIITPTGGYVKEINLKNGDVVKKGDIILKFEDVETESNYLQSEGELYKAKSDYETKKIAFEKYERLYKEEYVSEDTFLNFKNDLSQSYGVLKTAEGSYIDAKDKKERLVVKSPIDGIVADLDIKIQEKIKKDMEIVSIIDSSFMEIKVAVSGKSIGNIKTGDSAEVYIDDIKKTVSGKVVSINFSADEDTKKYQIKIVFPNEKGDILKGMYGKVKINQGKIEGLFVPKEAIMVRDLYSYIGIMRDGVALIYKVDSKGSLGDYQEIVFDDYKDGDRLIVEGQYLLNNNDKIKEREQ